VEWREECFISYKHRKAAARLPSAKCIVGGEYIAISLSLLFVLSVLFKDIYFLFVCTFDL
jgi:hypothetical protein